MNNTEAPESAENAPTEQDEMPGERRVYLCDRCGAEMIDRHCKVICPNCGARWDCSDISIYTD